MEIYIDSKNHCHTTNPDGTFQKVNHPFFDDKCATFIEGYCYEPENMKIYPWKNHNELDAAQREYERQKLADAENALAIMWGGVTV